MAGGKSRCCVRCGSYYTPTGSVQKYCPDCRLAVRAQQSSAYYQRQKAAAQANREVPSGPSSPAPTTKGRRPPPRPTGKS